MAEEKWCGNCRFDSLDETEEPCVRCKNTSVIGTDAFNTKPLLWKPVETVDHPDHYNQGKFECIEVMAETFGKEATENFCLLNAFKYIWRAGEKNGIEDIKKASWYLEKFLELEGESDE